jgi:hypothetical protein
VTKTEQSQLDISKKEQEDAFFNKWLKQRESKGISITKRIKGNEKSNSGTKKTKKTKTTTKTTEEDVGEDRAAKAGKAGTAGHEGTEDTQMEYDEDDIIGKTLAENVY